MKNIFWKAVSNKIAVVCCLFFVIMSFFIFNNHVISLALSGFICLNLIGLIVSLFLLEKQIYKDSTYGDKICSLLGEKQCGEVLELEVSKLWKTDFSWSEIGVAYFFTNTFIAVYVEDWLPYVYVLNLLSLPYPIWSIGYQKFVAKKWCILCVIVQIVILSIFIYNLSWNVFQFSGLQLWLFLIVGSLYMSILWVVNRISYLLKSEMEKRVISYQSNSVKMMPSVFKAILKTNKNYDMGKDVSHIVIGNPKAKLNIVILTNPYCNPCSDVCRDVVSLIDRIDINRISLQFVFMVFEESLKNIATLLISAYMSKGWEFFMDIYQRWYQEGKEKGEDFFHQYGVFVNKESQEEYRLHEAWIQKMEFNQTPMIFVNGYRLPHNYSILELRHFLD